MTKNVPDIRFAGFSGEWEERKLGSESTITAGGDVDKKKLLQTGKYPVLANALTKNGVVGFYEEDYRIEAPAVTVTGRGDVGHAKARNTNFTPVVRLLAIKSNHDVDFLESAINNHKIIVESTGVPQLTVPQLSKYKIYFPIFEEEKVIGSFIKRFDEVIALHQKKLDSVIKIKQGFLQKMFPKDGEVNPEIRFPGFTDDWEQRKLSEIIKLIGGNAFSSGSATNEGVPWLKIANVDKNGIDWSTRSFLPSGYWEKYPDYQLTPGDYVMALTRPILNHTLKIGKVDKLALLNQRVAKLDFNLGKKFTFQLIQRRTIVDKIENELAGTDPPNLGSKNLTNINVMITNNKDEQRKIGDFFNFLDDTIALHQRELELLKQTKKAFLQKMFV